MPRQKIQWTSAEKARWLAELARAIDEAQQIVWRIALIRGDNPRTSGIYGQLEAALDEVERLQRGAKRQAKLELGRDWSELLAGVAVYAEPVDYTPCGVSPPPEKG